MAKMKRSEAILWIMVAVALAANIWLPRHLAPKYSWERDLSQRIASDLTRPESIPLQDSSLTPSSRVRVRYSITVPKGTFRLRENLCCWLPFPKGAKLIEAGVNGIALPEDKITLSGASSPHGSLYMEARSSRYRDMVFHEVYEYSFLEDKVECVRDSISEWIRENIQNAPMKEYSTIGDIPAKVLEDKQGDEGAKALLYISMCKDKGIKARFRSGLEPVKGKVLLREWAEAYVEGQGWSPVVLSGETAPDPASIILINNGFGEDLFPAKKYPRSDGADFLRGEVEWEGGNLYFTQWNPDIQIEYLK